MDTIAIIGTAAGIIIPGVAAWVGLRIQVARLEERVRMHEDNSTKLDGKLDKIFDELKELRDALHGKQ